jgi:type VI protein secretion system component Hcp
MKINIILTVLLFPLFALCQTNQTYLKITDANGQMIKGSAVTKGFENAIQVTSMSAGGKNNTQISITMPVTGASADFKSALMNGKILPKGDLITGTSGMGALTLVNTIRLESVTVLSCTDAIGCNGLMNTTVVLNAVRIGWTYYAQDRTGVNTVSKKFGWDAAANREWTGF